MRLRPYIPSLDFEAVRLFITDERTHSIWCANRFSYPLSQQNFENVLKDHAERCEDCPFVAISDSGEVIGFFCLSVNSSKSGMLKFVVISPAVRGKGLGEEMIRLAVRYAFEIAGADSVHLCVFTENTAARKCYESAGFTKIQTDKNAFTYKDETWGRCTMEVKK
ncbi:MAG: GNAT family N-acetyltransferase [Ruminococcus sp.]|nr:GNAT family N-acetyltransferase [Ruminococcus sp.]